MKEKDRGFINTKVEHYIKEYFLKGYLIVMEYIQERVVQDMQENSKKENLMDMGLITTLVEQNMRGNFQKI
jgi:hypothetical protein